MGYLEAAEYEAYGLEAGTPDALIAMAGALMEGHCRRPSLLATEYVERVRLVAGATTARLSYGPLLDGCLVSVRARYGRGRRGDDLGLHETAQGLMGMQVATAFGLPGTWATLDVAHVDIYAAAREIGFAENWMGIGYNEVEVTYTAGFVTVPEQIKSACAQIVKNARNTPGLNVKTSKLDTMQMTYFAGSLVDEGVRMMLKPYVAERL